MNNIDLRIFTLDEDWKPVYTFQGNISQINEIHFIKDRIRIILKNHIEPTFHFSKDFIEQRCTIVSSKYSPEKTNVEDALLEFKKSIEEITKN